MNFEPVKGLCFPVLLELIYLWEHLSLRQQIFILIKNVPIILLSVIGFISGTTVSIKEIIKLYQWTQLINWHINIICMYILNIKLIGEK